jgi:hypothetical protein
VTAEIAIMNREGIALAADSAVTMREGQFEKVFTSANKIFALSSQHPVAAMIFGNAAFVGIPWEPIIKVFRNRLGKRAHRTVKQYAQEFLRFLRQQNVALPKQYQDALCQQHAAATLMSLRNRIERMKGLATQSGKTLDPKTVEAEISAAVQPWRKAP